MRKFIVLGVVLMSFMLASCSLVTRNHLNNDFKDVLKRAREFQQAENDADGEKIWNLSAPFIRKDIGSKEEYVDYLNIFLSETNYKAEEPTMVASGKKWALTQENTSMTFSEPDGLEKDCFRTFWIKSEGTWYWYGTGYICSYMPTKDEINQWTKNLK